MGAPRKFSGGVGVGVGREEVSTASLLNSYIVAPSLRKGAAGVAMWKDRNRGLPEFLIGFGVGKWICGVCAKQ